MIIPDPPEATSGVVSDGWLVVRTSVSGKSHRDHEPQIPCQDNSAYGYIGGGWGVAVVCDGAGSKKYSHHGSKFVSQAALRGFQSAVKDSGWDMADLLPSQEEWHSVAKKTHEQVLSQLVKYSKEEGYDLALLGCTVIVVIHAQKGVLATHIGDGRAALCGQDGEWRAVITPHKGEEANQTVFLTTVDWNDPDSFIESTVVSESPAGFVLLSDGCEGHSFEVNLLDEQTGIYHDPNRPYKRFFDPLVRTLRKSYEAGIDPEEIAGGWNRFIEDGSSKLKAESDDKTMLLGVRV